jgi:hypothetical protein
VIHRLALVVATVASSLIVGACSAPTTPSSGGRVDGGRDAAAGRPGPTKPLDEQPTGGWGDAGYARWEEDGGEECFGFGGRLRSCGDDYQDNYDCQSSRVPSKAQLNADIDAKLLADSRQ